jgi:PTH1 family peptidyl-tRNA hydrolase
MLLIVGLGNPGRRYEGHRHNIGFMAVDEIHRRHRFSPWRARFEGETSEGSFGSDKVLLLKPATYMNESGRSVSQAMRFYKLDAGDVVVIYDELDLPPGKLRMKTGGSAAGHKGLSSVAAHIGSEFRRMRLGIGHPGSRELVNGYVLHDFAKADHEWVAPLVATISDNLEPLVAGNDSTFMNRVHLATIPEEKPEAPAKEADRRDRGEDADAPRLPKSAKPEPERSIGGAFAGLKKLFGRER